MIEVTVTYPAPVGRFDMDYYINDHMALVKKVWGGMGLVKIEVVRGEGGAAPGAPAAFPVIARLVFDSMENLQKALPKAEAFASDIANFTDTQPQIQIGTVVLSETL